jgi:hypothetical protein
LVSGVGAVSIKYIFVSFAADYTVWSGSTDYEVARTTGALTARSSADTSIYPGQRLISGTYQSGQAYLGFDLTALGDDVYDNPQSYPATLTVTSSSIGGGSEIIEVRQYNWSSGAASWIDGNNLVNHLLLGSYTNNPSGSASASFSGAYENIVLHAQNQRLGVAPTTGAFADTYSGNATDPAVRPYLLVEVTENVQTRTFTTNSSFTPGGNGPNDPPLGVDIQIETWGAGGGGTVSTSAEGGGGGGGYARTLIPSASVVAASHTVTVGTGGSAGQGGGVSSVVRSGTTLTSASGGGSSAAQTGGAAGVGTVGSVLYSGGAGATGQGGGGSRSGAGGGGSAGSAGNGTAGTQIGGGTNLGGIGGAGGTPDGGKGGNGGVSGQPGQAGSVPGGGGGGGGNSGGNGGAGARGEVKISWIVPPSGPPTITSTNTGSVNEGAAFTKTLTANRSVTWSIVGGADAAHFSISGNVLSMTAKDFENPLDADGNNTYIVTVRATDAGGFVDQTITVTVLDVVEVYPPYLYDFSGYVGQPLSAHPNWDKQTWATDELVVQSNGTLKLPGSGWRESQYDQIGATPDEAWIGATIGMVAREGNSDYVDLVIFNQQINNVWIGYSLAILSNSSGTRYRVRRLAGANTIDLTQLIDVEGHTHDWSFRGIVEGGNAVVIVYQNGIEINRVIDSSANKILGGGKTTFYISTEDDIALTNLRTNYPIRPPYLYDFSGYTAGAPFSTHPNWTPVWPDPGRDNALVFTSDGKLDGNATGTDGNGWVYQTYIEESSPASMNFIEATHTMSTGNPTFEVNAFYNELNGHHYSIDAYNKTGNAVSQYRLGKQIGSYQTLSSMVDVPLGSSLGLRATDRGTDTLLECFVDGQLHRTYVDSAVDRLSSGRVALGAYDDRTTDNFVIHSVRTSYEPSEPPPQTGRRLPPRHSYWS